MSRTISVRWATAAAASSACKAWPAQIDIVMGSFSKTFASNGGFVSCNSPAVKQYLKFYGCSATFSNALSPVQSATVTKAFEIVQSDRGRELRRMLLKRVGQMRDALTAVD